MKHSNSNNEKNGTKNKLKAFTFFTLLPVIKTKTVIIQAQKFNKHSYTKDSPEHDFICQSGSYAGLPWSHAQTCMFSFSEEERFRQMTQRTQNSSYIGQCECAVRQFFDSYRAGDLLRRSHTYWGAQPIWILNISTAGVVHKLFLQWKDAYFKKKVLPSLTESDQVI